jgi:hypothetical protein
MQKNSWSHTLYDFALTYTSDRIEIAIDGQLIFEVAAAEVGLTFEAGRFGFYNYSQSGVRYADFSEGAVEDL